MHRITVRFMISKLHEETARFWGSPTASFTPRVEWSSDADVPCSRIVDDLNGPDAVHPETSRGSHFIPLDAGHDRCSVPAARVGRGLVPCSWMAPAVTDEVFHPNRPDLSRSRPFYDPQPGSIAASPVVKWTRQDESIAVLSVENGPSL